MMKLREQITGNTKDAPIECAWGPQGSGGATDAPETQVVYKVQQLRGQKNQKLKVSDRASYKNKLPQTYDQRLG